VNDRIIDKDGLVIDSRNVDKAIELIGDFYQEEIIVEPCSDKRGGSSWRDNRILIRLNPAIPSYVREAIFIHEVLHRLLEFEQYLTFKFTPPADLAQELIDHWTGIFKKIEDVAHHPEIHRRMEDYNFDIKMDVYYADTIQAYKNTEFRVCDDPFFDDFGRIIWILNIVDLMNLNRNLDEEYVLNPCFIADKEDIDRSSQLIKNIENSHLDWHSQEDNAKIGEVILDTLSKNWPEMVRFNGFLPMTKIKGENMLD
jgi:hypothetical protein